MAECLYPVTVKDGHVYVTVNLREWLAEHDTDNPVLSEMKRLYNENAKLREFATETWELLTCNEPVFVWEGLQEKARELGVEVDDG